MTSAMIESTTSSSHSVGQLPALSHTMGHSRRRWGGGQGYLLPKICSGKYVKFGHFLDFSYIY